MDRTRTAWTLIISLAMALSCALATAQPAADQTDTDQSDGAAAAIATPPTPAANAEAPDTAVTFESVLESFGTIFEQTPYWAWLALFLSILAGLIIGKSIQLLLRRLAESATKHGREMRYTLFHGAAGPVYLLMLAVGVQVGLLNLRMPEEIFGFMRSVLSLFFILSIGWFIFNLVDLVHLAIMNRVSQSESKLARQIAPLIRKAFRIFIVIVFVLFTAQNIFGVNISAWLAGLGIAGLAISLASQNSVANLFGSITVMLDKPFVVGDRITFNGADGFVEEIGLRSTRIRTFTGHLVTVPNMRFIDGTVENVSSRPFIRRNMSITITYDTPPEKIEEAVSILKGLLDADDIKETFRIEDRPPRVFFNEFNADSLNIAVSYWYFLDADKGHDWWHYQEHAQRLNLRLFHAFKQAGIDFAFPTQTLYLAGDPDRQLSVRLLNENPAGADKPGA
ncbi:MAG: mechanosensitive ion channel family protein [Phycisphaerales bacterium]|nr:mechanosensitive ion channel family protein [Planctomycetota bacterium]MCH8508503.1 mechanosensitive ion channel family protein [Phycisphaerales bacterium]